MTLRDTFMSRVAAAALVSGLTLGVGAAAYAQGAPGSAAEGHKTEASLIQTHGWGIDPLLPIPVTAGLTLAFLAVCGYAGMRRTRGSLPRVAAGLTVAAALINPQIVEENREQVPTEIVVVVDKTASQNLQNRTHDTEVERDSVTKALSGLKDVRVRTIEVSESKDKTASDGSNLFGSLEEGLADIPGEHLGAVIMLTDGQIHDTPNQVPPRINAAPINALISGNENEHDRRIVLKKSPRFGLVNKSQEITFAVIDDGKAPAGQEKARVTVTLDGKNLVSQFVTPGKDTTIKIDIPHVGSNLVELKTDIVAGELTDINNRTVAAVEGIRENLNVLVISGEPNAGTRMWDMFKADPDNNLILFTALRTPSKLDNTPYDEMALMPFPLQEIFSSKINKFDLIILDHFSNDGILPRFYFQSIVDYVNDGGSLLVVAGPNYATDQSLYGTTLEAILPAAPNLSVIQRSFVPQISKRGQRHPVTRNLGGADAATSPPWGEWFSVVDSTVMSGDTVMEGADKKPLLILDRKEKGRVGMLMSDNLWLWGRGDKGGPQLDLISRVSQWLMKNPALEEEALRFNKENGKLVVEQQTMSDVSTPVTVKLPSGGSISVTLQGNGNGLWRAEVPSTELGLYSAEQGGKFPLKTFINVGTANPREFATVISLANILNPLADKTGGRIMRMNSPSGALVTPNFRLLKGDEFGKATLADNEMAIRMTQATILKGIDRTPVLPPWAAAMMVIGLLGAAFYREGETSLFGKKEIPKKSPPGNNGPSL